MLNWLKKDFIPHDGNEHRPHFLRNENLRHIVAIILFVELATFVVPSILNMNLSGGIAAVLPAVLGELTNEKRQEEKLPMLFVNPLLTRAAEMKAQNMAENGYFAHTSPEGRTPWYWIELAGYKYKYAGENLAVNFRDSEDVTSAWLASPTHRANIVKGNYTEMGTGVANGYYKGKKTVFVAQVYANPLSASGSASALIKPKIIAPMFQAIAPAKPEVLGAETPKQPNLLQKHLASPRDLSNTVMLTLAGLVGFALVVYLVIKRKDHHRDMIGNGLAALAIVGALLLANHYLSFNKMVITESYDYSLEDTL